MLKPDECTLFSGAANGAEAQFGTTAERFGIDEVNFSFEGHNDARARGLRVLTHEELSRGDVSLTYVGRMMNREYSPAPIMKRVLQCIWHQVNNGQEIYVVGKILDDGHVKGGTGWGAEFAKLCNKALFVFDQDKDSWFQWEETRFKPVTNPVIGHAHFTGTGTRFLEENGRRAIEGLFTRSFRG